MTETAAPTLEEALKLEASIQDANKKKDQFELTRLKAASDYMDGTAFNNVLAKMTELAEGSLPGGQAWTAITNLRAGLDTAKRDITQRQVSLEMKINPTPPVPAVPDLSAGATPTA